MARADRAGDKGDKSWGRRSLPTPLPVRLAAIGAIFAALLVLGLALPVASQSTRFGMPWHSVDGGGGTGIGARFELAGSIGQPDAGSVGGERFSIVGGFQSPDLREEIVSGQIYLPVLRMRD